MTVSANSTPLTVAREEAVDKNLGSNFIRVLCIQYSINFKQKFMLALLNSGNKVNAIHPTFVKELGLLIKSTNIRVQKIDGITLDIFRMVVAAFSVTDKANRVRFFEETFLVANVSPEIVLGISFLTLSSADIDFLVQKLRWRTYTAKKAFPTIRRVKLVGKKEFAAAAVDLKYEIFVVHITSLNSTPLVAFNVYLFWRPQISGLIDKKVPIKVSVKYSDFVDIFSLDLASELPEHTGINDHAIKLVNDYQQPTYKPINSLGPVELEMLKTYNKTNLANWFIKLFKSPAGAPILFNQKSDSSLWLYVNYRGLNNLTIKNQYLLPLIGESLNRLKRARRFTQLNLISAYYSMRICKGDKEKTAFKTRYG